MVSHINSDMMLISTYDISFHSFYSQPYYLPCCFRTSCGNKGSRSLRGFALADPSVTEHATLDTYRAGKFPSFMPLEFVITSLRLRPAFPTMP